MSGLQSLANKTELSIRSSSVRGLELLPIKEITGSSDSVLNKVVEDAMSPAIFVTEKGQ